MIFLVQWFCVYVQVSALLLYYNEIRFCFSSFFYFEEKAATVSHSSSEKKDYNKEHMKILADCMCAITHFVEVGTENMSFW